jgi:hypothetical protein
MDPALVRTTKAVMRTVRAGRADAFPAGIVGGGGMVLVAHDVGFEDLGARGSPMELCSWRLVFEDVLIDWSYALAASHPRISSAHGFVVRAGWTLGVRFLDATPRVSDVRCSVLYHLQDPPP